MSMLQSVERLASNSSIFIVFYYSPNDLMDQVSYKEMKYVHHLLLLLQTLLSCDFGCIELRQRSIMDN